MGMDEHVGVFRYNKEAENPLFSIIAINGKVAEVSLFDMYLGEQPYSKNLFCVCGQNSTIKTNVKELNIPDILPDSVKLFAICHRVEYNTWCADIYSANRSPNDILYRIDDMYIDDIFTVVGLHDFGPDSIFSRAERAVIIERIYDFYKNKNLVLLDELASSEIDLMRIYTEDSDNISFVKKDWIQKYIAKIFLEDGFIEVFAEEPLKLTDESPGVMSFEEEESNKEEDGTDELVYRSRCIKDGFVTRKTEDTGVFELMLSLKKLCGK